MIRIADFPAVPTGDEPICMSVCIALAAAVSVAVGRTRASRGCHSYFEWLAEARSQINVLYNYLMIVTVFTYPE